MEKDNLINLFNRNEQLISIIGLGYVGLPLMLTFAEKGCRVLGLDIDIDKVNSINQGKSYFKHINHNRILDLIEKNFIRASNDFSEVSKSDAIIICVPTPLNEFREPDLSFIKDTLKSIIPFLKKGQILSLESTTYPGTTEEIICSEIKSLGLKIGENFFVVYSPEREDPGNRDFNTSNIPKVLGGSTKSCCEVGTVLYKKAIEEVVKVSSTKTAEMTKLLENIHRSVNIGLINELKPLADKMGIDIYEVIKAASTKPFGFVPYYPGPGLGGHCIPIDPFYLTWKARQYHMNTKFIELAGEINTSMPNYVMQKIGDALNNFKKPFKGSKILILGISYKKNIDDMRESPSVELMKLLTNKGAIIDFSDPFFNEFPKMRKYKFNLKSVFINKENLIKYDLILLATDHDNFDYKLIKENSKIIVDTRGRFETNSKIIRA